MLWVHLIKRSQSTTDKKAGLGSQRLHLPVTAILLLVHMETSQIKPFSLNRLKLNKCHGNNKRDHHISILLLSGSFSFKILLFLFIFFCYQVGLISYYLIEQSIMRALTSSSVINFHKMALNPRDRILKK